MKFLKFLKKKPLEDEYEVQLHRVTWEIPGTEGWYGPLKILNSWEPIVVRGLKEAELTEVRLRMDNRWGNQKDWPHVTVTKKNGE
jgi:hypothetical protein